MIKDEENRLSSLEQDILIVIGNRRIYGLDILSQINDCRPIEIGCGSLYPTLSKLEKRGLILSQLQGKNKPEKLGGAKRKYYIRTKKGEELLEIFENYRNQLRERGLSSETEVDNAIKL